MTAAATATTAIHGLAQRLDVAEAELAGTRSLDAIGDALMPRLTDALLLRLLRAEQRSDGDGVLRREQETGRVGQEQEQRQQQPQQAEGGAAGPATRTQEVPAAPELLSRQLSRWKGVCLVCKAAGRDARHSNGDCATEQGRQADTEMRDMLRAIKYDRFSGCFECGVPQAVCNRWERSGRNSYRQNKGEECQFRDVMAGVLYGVKYGYPEMWGAWRVRLEGLGAVRAVSDEQVFSYLGRQWKKNGLESNRLVQEFMWLAGRLEDNHVGSGDRLVAM